MTNGHVLGFLGAPDRQTSLRAISLALLKVRALDGMTCEKIGNALECSADTIRAASNEENLLSAVSMARLLYFFPEQCGPIADLWGRAADEPSLEDRLERIERELDAIRREAAQ